MCPWPLSGQTPPGGSNPAWYVMAAARVASKRTRELALSAAFLEVAEKQRSVVSWNVQRRKKNKKKVCAGVVPAINSAQTWSP